MHLEHQLLCITIGEISIDFLATEAKYLHGGRRANQSDVSPEPRH